MTKTFKSQKIFFFIKELGTNLLIRNTSIISPKLFFQPLLFIDQ